MLENTRTTRMTCYFLPNNLCSEPTFVPPPCIQRRGQTREKSPFVILLLFPLSLSIVVCIKESKRESKSGFLYFPLKKGKEDSLCFLLQLSCLPHSALGSNRGRRGPIRLFPPGVRVSQLGECYKTPIFTNYKKGQLSCFVHFLFFLSLIAISKCLSTIGVSKKKSHVQTLFQLCFNPFFSVKLWPKITREKEVKQKSNYFLLPFFRPSSKNKTFLHAAAMKEKSQLFFGSLSRDGPISTFYALFFTCIHLASQFYRMSVHCSHIKTWGKKKLWHRFICRLSLRAGRQCQV